ncbi:hypothetical protein B0T24DRAFT_683236 [Lasiosphaeria ovina]|uniref:Pre-mRNA-splicing factor SPF27 n=1 Tax=Lasiosphaeria ovina TaxID=92902 RepID=A0AAE0JY70_9PEZI|nr:hypothetical protein B0T24DRAFT_683236 [Lasiosphaeria ovina]
MNNNSLSEEESSIALDHVAEHRESHAWFDSDIRGDDASRRDPTGSRYTDAAAATLPPKAPAPVRGARAYGKNAWLVGNWQLEGCVRAVERELASVRRAIDVVALQRQRAQDEFGPELKGLDETWRRGLSRVLETEAAAEGLRREILEVRRQRPKGGTHAQS